MNKRYMILFSFVLLFSLTSISAYIIEGNKIYIDDDKVYISANPHTITENGWVIFDVRSKVYTGDMDVILGFDTTKVKPVKAGLLYNGEWKDISGIWSSIDYDYGGMNKWFYKKDVPIIANRNYKMAVFLVIDRKEIFSPDLVDVKYWFAVKPSPETIQQAIANNHFYALDPWINSTGADQNKNYLSTGLIHYYDFEEGIGTTTEDKAGTNDLTLLNGTGWTTGIIGNATALDGIDDVIQSSEILNITGNSPRTFNFWTTLGIKTYSPYAPFFIASGENPNHFNVGLNPGGQGSNYLIQYGKISGSDITFGSWDLNTNMHTITVNSSSISWFINGVLNYTTGNNVQTSAGTLTDFIIGNSREFNSGYLNASMLDELGIWNRSLNATEISDLWNGGYGLSYSQAITINTPPSPADNYISLPPKQLTFNCSSLYELQNITLFINSFPNTTQIGSNFQTTLTFNDYGSYQWMCSGRDASNFLYNSSTRTFDISPLVENSQIYDYETIEKTKESFYINVTYDTSVYTSNTAVLVYNGTSYYGSTSDTGNNRIYFTSIDVPAVTSNTNFIFYWDFTLINSTATIKVNSTFNNQTVLNLNIDNCSSYTNLLYNFTVRDEADRTILDGGTNNVTTEIDLTFSSYGTENEFLTYSQTYSYTNPAMICLEIPLNQSIYRIDLTGGYESLDYVKKFYYIDNGTITNNTIPQHIDLHALPLDDSTSFLFTFIDTDGLIVEGAIVHVDRKYIGEGIFREVERAKTDDSGETHVHLVQEDVIYRFRITKDSRLLYTSTEYQAKCLSTPCEIEIRASGEYFGINEDEWDSMEGGYYTISKDDSTRQISLLFYSDPTATLNMNFTAYSYTSENGRQAVASSSLSSISGMITLTVPQSYGNQTYIYAVYKDNELVVWGWFSLIKKGIDFFGNTLGVILTAFLVLTLGLMAITEGVAVIVFLLLGLGLAGALKLLELGWIALICLITAGGILIWKLTKRRRG